MVRIPDALAPKYLLATFAPSTWAGSWKNSYQYRVTCTTASRSGGESVCVYACRTLITVWLSVR